MRRLATLAVTAVIAAGCGSGGETGPKGPSGTKTVLYANPSFSGTGTGYYCQTAPYTAHANEGVIMTAAVSCNAVPASGGSIGVRTAYNDGTVDTNLPWTVVSTNWGTSTSYQTATNTGYLALTAGTTYMFEAWVYLSGASGTCFCDMTAEVVGQ